MLALGEFFLGDDGNLYQLQGLQALMTAEQGEAGLAGAPRLPRCFLGEDGTLMKLEMADRRVRSSKVVEIDWQDDLYHEKSFISHGFENDRR